MRLHRFYVNKPLGEEIVVENVDGEKEMMHQWTHVFRYTSGDEVILFSPETPGTDFLYHISSISKQEITLLPVSSSSNIIPGREVTLVMTLVKKDTFETITRQATELGVTRIIPVTASRSEKKNLNFERLETIATEAAEQSGRGTVPVISQILTFSEALDEAKDCINIVGSLQGEKGFAADKNKLCLWVGPEGGWTEKEEAEFRNKGFTLVKLTDTVLKADTAATALLSVILSSLH